LKDCVSPGRRRISAWSAVKKSARPLIEGRAAQPCGILPIETRPRGIWPLEAPQKELGYRAKSCKRPAYRNATVERTPTLPCCRDIKTA